jgi:DNA-binding CsgD family transcriptional regulator
MYSQPGVTASLIACYYEGITAPRRHTEGLQQIAEQLNCDHANLTIWDRGGNWGRTHRAMRRNNGWQLGVEENGQSARELRTQVDRMEPGQWQIHESLHTALPEANIIANRRSVSRFDSMLCIRLLSVQGAEIFLSLKQNRFSWKTATKALQLAENMVRPLGLAMDMMIQMRKLTQQAANLSTVLDCIRMPLLMLDGAMHVLVANTLAKPLIQTCHGNGPQQGQMCLTGVPVERFAALVRRACGQLGPVAAGSLQLVAPDGQPGMQLVVLPIAANPAEAKSASALVIICGQQLQQDSADQLLQHIYGLTPAEARLALLILHGKAPNVAAAQLQVSVATVRSQLSAVLKKTGALRQPDLVRRLSSILLINQRVARSPS